jgi:hypothetical protein
LYVSILSSEPPLKQRKISYDKVANIDQIVQEYFTKTKTNQQISTEKRSRTSLGMSSSNLPAAGIQDTNFPYYLKFVGRKVESTKLIETIQKAYRSFRSQFIAVEANVEKKEELRFVPSPELSKFIPVSHSSGSPGIGKYILTLTITLRLIFYISRE